MIFYNITKSIDAGREVSYFNYIDYDFNMCNAFEVNQVFDMIISENNWDTNDEIMSVKYTGERHYYKNSHVVLSEKSFQRNVGR